MITPSHRHAVRTETTVSVAINALIPTAIIWLAGVAAPATFGGPAGLWLGMAKGSGIATLLMTLIVTMLIRGRVKAGKVPSLSPENVPGMIGMLPGSVLVRAIAMALLAMLVLVPLGSVIAALLDILPLDARRFALFNLLFGTMVGLTMTPIVVLRALADPVRG